jgi:negative regulator of sigma E activity
MNEQTQEARTASFEARSRELFRESVDGVDMRIRSRLTQARHASLESAAAARPRSWLFRLGPWTPAAGVTAAALLGAALWFGLPGGNHGMTAADNQPSLEDLDIVASSDEGSGDAIEMLQNDLDFYDFSDRAANPGPAA